MEILYVYIYKYILIIITLWFLYMSFVASCLRPVDLPIQYSLLIFSHLEADVLYVLVCCYVIWTHTHKYVHTNATSSDSTFETLTSTNDATIWHCLSYTFMFFFCHEFILTDKHELRTQTCMWSYWLLTCTCVSLQGWISVIRRGTADSKTSSMQQAG